jgi:hypothetical protein
MGSTRTGSGCLHCGMCCTHPDPYAKVMKELTAEDLQRLAPQERVQYVAASTWGRLALKANFWRYFAVCACLTGTPGKQGGAGCAIYGRRPLSCKQIEPGGKLCTYLRGLGPPGPRRRD